MARADVPTKDLAFYIAVLVLGGAVGLGARLTLEARSQPVTLPVVHQTELQSESEGPIAALPDEQMAMDAKLGGNFVARAAAKALPAVVRLETFGRGVDPRSATAGERLGTGSGVVLDREGLILTNAHVLADAATVIVTLADGRSRSAQIVGRKGAADVALLRITPEPGDEPLNPLPLGRSDRLVAGQWAIAIGHPLGLDRSVTVGVVSAPRRRADWVGLGHRAVEFIQTDAAINPGNSGGPLLDDRGRAMGISTAIRADVPGVGFAIPIEDALQAAELILAEASAAAKGKDSGQRATKSAKTPQ
ncbi:MAG: hypothetical protein Fur0042_16550 [Cyanophyceae cyanobacterium]